MKRKKMIYLTRIKDTLPEHGQGIRLAIYQGQRPVGTKDAIQRNIETLEKLVKKAKEKFEVQLISFPELYITGYALNPPLVRQLAEEKDGPSLTRVAEIAQANEMAIICPYPERDSASGKEQFYDSIAFFDASGHLLQNYRKTHLFGKAERDNYSFGAIEEKNPYPVNNVAGFPVGILNCYEGEFPELFRILALKGAKLIVVPTAADFYYTLTTGEQTRVPYPDVSRNLFPAHAYTNNIFTAYSNRRGWETVEGHSWHYRGNSIICGPDGSILVAPEQDNDTIRLGDDVEDILLIADCIPDDYLPTHPEGNYLKNRRPELYQTLVDMTVECEGGHTYSKNPPE